MKGKFKTPMVCRAGAISVFLMLILGSGAAWAQVTVSPGDIVVSDGNATIEIELLFEAQDPLKPSGASFRIPHR